MTTRRCTACGQDKPAAEFYVRNRDGRTRKICPRCRDCDNTRTRARTEARVVRVRARHRAVADLIARHRVEFDTLLEHHAAASLAEVATLATAAAASTDQHGHDPEPAAEPLPRLRPGPRRPGQTVTERLDVARCAQCVKHHDRGHTCPSCGAIPMTRDEMLAAVRAMLADGRDVIAIGEALRMPMPRVGELVDAALSAERAS